MAVNWLGIVNSYPYGIDVTERSIFVDGQLIPWTTTNPLLSVVSFSITSNVVTFTTSTNTLTGGGGDVVSVAGIPAPYLYLNGVYTTTAATSTTFTAALTHANVATTQIPGVATLTPNYTTGGLAFGGFISNKGVTISIPQVGPKQLQLPKKWEGFSLLVSTSAKNHVYPANLTVNPFLILNLSGATEATTATAVPTDVIGFRAEYIKDLY